MVCRETWSLSANTTMHGEQSITDYFSLKRRKPIPSLTGGQHSKIVSDGMLRKHILLQHVNVSDERKGRETTNDGYWQDVCLFVHFDLRIIVWLGVLLPRLAPLLS